MCINKVSDILFEKIYTTNQRDIVIVPITACSDSELTYKSESF
jgi:hypothetical protein